jgi:hypothetical protein
MASAQFPGRADEMSLVSRAHPAALFLANEQDFDLALESIKQEPQPSLRYQMYERLAAYAESAQQMIDPLHEKLWIMLKNDTEAWQKSGFTISDVESTFANLKLNAESAYERRQYRDEAQRGLKQVGAATQDWTIICPQDRPSESLLKIAARCARTLSAVPFIEPEVTEIVNHMVMLRREAGTRGGARILGPSTTDYQKAMKVTRAKYGEIPPYTDEDFARLGLRRNAYGLLEVMPTAQQGAVIGLLEPDSLGDHAAGQRDAQQRSFWSAPGGDQNPGGESSDQIRPLSPPSHKRHPSGLLPEDLPVPDGNQQPGLAARPRRSTKKVRYDESAPEASEDDHLAPISDDDGNSRGTREACSNKANECNCGLEVTHRFRKLITKHEKIQAVLPSEVARMRLAQQFADLISIKALVCARHIKATATAVGLRTRLRTDVLRERLIAYAQSRSNSATLKTDVSTFNWFALSVRPRHPSEIRGVYKYDPSNAEDPTKFMPALKEIFRDLDKGANESVKAAFERDGNVMLPVFTWWLTPKDASGTNWSILEMARIEFDMYDWHFRSNYGNSGSLGWLRNMYHSGIQQLMRQDPEYYRSYVALRPDHHWRLISYPYYAKYSKQGDSTFFRHIDINVEQYLRDGRGGNMIQGSVSLDNETNDMCTEVLLKMHTRARMEEWRRRVSLRQPDKKALSDWVSRVQDKNVWGPSDAKHFGTDFTPLPCPKGYARITSPLLPHGSTIMPDREAVRRTMLPWLVGIQANHSDMEVLEMGTWQEIAAAHVALDAAPRSPSGKPNVYGGIPYRFPASIPLTIPSPLSQALVGRTRWDMPDVIDERDIVLGKNTEKYQRWLKDWREKATVAYRQHFLAVQKLESKLYGGKSYFYHGGDVAKAPPADTDMTEEIRLEIEADIKLRRLPIEAHGQENTADFETDDTGYERLSDSDVTARPEMTRLARLT